MLLCIVHVYLADNPLASVFINGFDLLINSTMENRSTRELASQRKSVPAIKREREKERCRWFVHTNVYYNVTCYNQMIRFENSILQY